MKAPRSTEQALDLAQLDGHTPGPWMADTYGIRDVGGYIVELHWPHRYEGQDARFQKETSEREGDARLIAAAPAMLAELRALRAERDAMEKMLKHIGQLAAENTNGAHNGAVIFEAVRLAITTKAAR